MKKYYDLQQASRHPDQVQQLILFNRGLSEIPEEVRTFKYLKFLALPKNRIKTIPDWIFELNFLSRLDLSDNQLNLIPPFPSTFVELNFSNNKLSDAGVANFPESLRVLKMAHCELTKMPSSIFSLNDLRTLDLSQNEIAGIPAGIKALKSLEKLNLQENQLQKLPETFFTLQNLRYLNLENNKLKHLPPEIRQMEKLQTVNLSINKVSFLPESLFTLPFLREIDLSSNKLNEIGGSPLPNTFLRKLNLSNNRIELLPDQFFSGAVTQFDLRKNKIKALPTGPFFEKIRQLQFDQNPLKQQNPPIDFLWSLKYLELINGIKGSRKAFRFLKSCFSTGTPLKFRSSLYHIYVGESFLPKFDETLFIAGLNLPFPTLHKKLWSWRNSHFPGITLKLGDKISFFGKPAIRKSIIEKSGLIFLDQENPNADYWIAGKQGGQLQKNHPPFVAVSVVQDFIKNESAVEELQVVRIVQLIENPGIGNLQLALAMVGENKLPPVLTTRFHQLWELQTPGPLKDQLGRILTRHTE